MAAVGFVFGVKPGAVELCQGLGLPQTVTATSRSLDGSCSLPSAFVTISKLPPVYTVLQSSSLSLRLRTVTSSAAITSFFDTSSEISKFGFSTGRLWRVEHGPNVRVQSLGATEEAHMPFEKDRRSLETTYFTETSPPTPPSRSRDRADDLSLNNPLLRQHRLGCGWLGVVLEWEGVIVEDDSELERKAWTALAEEEGKRPPPAFILKRAEGMKNEQAISEVLCWSRDFLQMKRLAIRKEELYEEMQGGLYRLRPGSREFVQTLKKHEIPIAVASTRPRKYLERAIEAVGMEGFFSVVLAAEDVYRGKPDPEMFMYAAERLGFIPERCIVFGNSNSSVEAAHDGCMKCVAVAGKHPVYELSAGDLVVRRLDDLSVVDLKNLSDLDSPEFQIPEPELELEVEEERTLPQVTTKDW
ncbi:5-amino-6-(5-phospho-D-ribitylamino)uracil phosphatase, chloroplastic [Physcomitrium patens]|nr:5-amino-6-(5-phospho-D-ribitylamino)uracil phosphatase, chloroplastic-like [Physcomitrium patens]XP_024381036.1 5-amino-6-(5-phospho-D-ribitylamino)uracil phosphatase, chloroplastic-like [Physcomitrium patens]XP_024381037.1 5-amino-6-(5-phospho-D-ribitylamino)uracil phosphatase, chloroplastic-like [Physcomitrium patens]XP_024381038.1 5-amino-6-(5-phospho-D-ribitylamino)uracil phosphatase, chloroplastic-like [Physcomitrium patens]XP_024381039.1 5-amino-6-(5-phospho-D-ribitylamino)uracil phosp|eukprot:XP_024381035.1 5-amino-6-(5-phospho-D-ribitylamino)uracil phosphatase, chloroplastic-like [Physcomitrella patens]